MAYATAFKLCLGNYSEGKSRNFADKCNLGLIVVIEHGGYFIAHFFTVKARILDKYRRINLMFVENTPTNTYGDEHRELMIMTSQSEQSSHSRTCLDSSVAIMGRWDGIRLD